MRYERLLNKRDCTIFRIQDVIIRKIRQNVFLFQSVASLQLYFKIEISSRMSVIILISRACVFLVFLSRSHKKSHKTYLFWGQGAGEDQLIFSCLQECFIIYGLCGKMEDFGGGGGSHQINRRHSSAKTTTISADEKCIGNKTCNLCNHLGLGTSMVQRLSLQVYKICKCILFNYNTIPRKENVLPETL